MNSEAQNRNSLSAVRPPELLDVFLLGLVDFSAAEALQQSFETELRAASRHRAVLLICEHPHCFSRGTDPLTMLPTTDLLQRQQEQFHSTSRAGGLIEHGPAQLAIYPIFSLAQMEISPLSFRDTQELLTARLCRLFGAPEVEIIKGTGVSSRTGMLAKTALQIRRQISQFGLYLNVSQVYSLGEDRRSSSLSSATLKHIDLASLKSALIELYSDWLDQPQLNTFTRHPLLKRKFLPPGT